MPSVFMMIVTSIYGVVDGLFVSNFVGNMCSLVFQVIFVLLLPALFKVDSIWWAMFATELCAFVISVIMFIAYRNRYHYV